MEHILKKITAICFQYPDIQKAVLFGSRGRGTHQATSDFDLAFYLQENPEGKTQIHLAHALEELDCLQKIDVVFISSHTDPHLLENIQKEGVTLMERHSKLDNLKRAVERLEEAIAICQETPNDFYYDGLIQRFEFSTELAWKTCKEYLENLGYTQVHGPKPVMREAFSAGLIGEDAIWIAILTDRNLTSHIYDVETARAIAHRVITEYGSEFAKLVDTLSQK